CLESCRPPSWDAFSRPVAKRGLAPCTQRGTDCPFVLRRTPGPFSARVPSHAVSIVAAAGRLSDCKVVADAVIAARIGHFQGIAAAQRQTGELDGPKALVAGQRVAR